MSIVNGSLISGANGRIDVFVRKAKDLPNLRKLDKQDPFVKLRVAHLTQTSDKVSRGGQTPVFNFHCMFNLTPDMKPILFVELYDDQKTSPKLIGKCEIDLTPGLYSDPEDGYDSWYNLHVGDEEMGRIYVELTFTPNTIGKYHSLNEENTFERLPRAQREPPILPEVPNVRFNSNNRMISQVPLYPHYIHHSGISQKSFPITREDYARNLKDETNTYDFESSVHTSSTYESEISQNTGITAKLKQLKEKWNNFKQGSNVQASLNHVNVDLEALQKAVGISSPERCISPTSSNYTDKNSSNPPLPPLPNNSHLESSTTKSQSPKLPPLPDSSHNSRMTSLSPQRRRPPPPR